MPRTELNSEQILDGTLKLVDLNEEVLDRLCQFPKSIVYVYTSTNQTLTSGNNKILFQAEIIDNLGEFDTMLSKFVSRNNQFCIINGCISISQINANKHYYVNLFKNGSILINNDIIHTNTKLDIYLNFYWFINLKINDYIEIYVNSPESGKQLILGQNNTYLKIYTI